MPKHRIQLDLTTKERDDLDKLGKVIGSVSRAETIRRAIRAVLVLEKATDKEYLVL